MKQVLKKEVSMAILILLLGQLIFFIASPGFLTAKYVSRIYATTAVVHKSEDLHQLNDAAHYFAQTMIGWLKFPHFFSQLNEVAPLPEGSQVTAHIQERQNIIFEVVSPQPIDEPTLQAVQTFIQGKIDQYNAVSSTTFKLSNTDHEFVVDQKSYALGAGIAFILSVILIGASWFLRRELIGNKA